MTIAPRWVAGDAGSAQLARVRSVPPRAGGAEPNSTRGAGSPATCVRVVMIGGGYAALHAYRALRRQLRAGRVQITVIAQDDRHNFHGFTGDVVASFLLLDVT